MQNSETGEIKELKSLSELPKGWKALSIDDLITIKHCAFRLQDIDIENQTITFKAISKKMARNK